MRSRKCLALISEYSSAHVPSPHSMGWIPYTDWEVLSSTRLWGGFTPLVIHLIARGLTALLSGIVQLTVVLMKKICRCGSSLGWAWLVISVSGVMACSGVGGICLLISWIFIAVSTLNIQYLLVHLMIFTHSGFPQHSCPSATSTSLPEYLNTAHCRLVDQRAQVLSMPSRHIHSQLPISQLVPVFVHPCHNCQYSH